MRVVLVTGSRERSGFWDNEVVYRVLTKFKPDLVMHGGARGIDSLADKWAEHNGVLCLVFPALWDEEGKEAGTTRNQRMVEIAATLKHHGHRVQVFAFPSANGSGTQDCMLRAYEAGLRVAVEGGEKV